MVFQPVWAGCPTTAKPRTRPTAKPAARPMAKPTAKPPAKPRAKPKVRLLALLRSPVRAPHAAGDKAESINDELEPRQIGASEGPPFIVGTHT